MTNERITMKAVDAAAYIGCSYWMILELAKQRKIPFIKVGNRILFRKDTLNLWMENQEAGSTKGWENQ